jgi:hypothetical protein
MRQLIFSFVFSKIYHQVLIKSDFLSFKELKVDCKQNKREGSLDQWEGWEECLLMCQENHQQMAQTVSRISQVIQICLVKFNLSHLH